MQIDLKGMTARIEGHSNAISTTLRDRLAENGAKIIKEGLPDLLILAAPQLLDISFDWDGLTVMARRDGTAMKTRGSGRIVFLLSACAVLPIRRQPDFSMQMAAMNALMRTLAMSLAPEVAANALGTGVIGTDPAHLQSGDAEMTGHVPVSRAGTVTEACNVALFLCDPENSYLTGQLLSADGGWTAGYGRSF